VTIRGGGSARDERSPAPPGSMAHRVGPGNGGPTPGSEAAGQAAAPAPGPAPAGQAHAAPRPVAWRDEPAWDAAIPVPARTARRRGGGGIGGSIRFLAFLLVMAAIVLVGLVTVARPALNGLVLAVAGENPGAWSIGFVADVVREDLGNRLTEPASDDPAVVTFAISSGESASQIADRLEKAGLVRDARAFLFIAVERGLTSSFEAGEHVLRRNMTPDQLVGALLEARDPTVVLQLRPGLRLEQVTALLQARPPEIASLQLDAADFYDLVTAPPASLLADYPWLDLPGRATLEGYLAGGSYRLLPDATAEELVRQMLDRWYADVGPERLAVPKARGLSFSEVLVLASIVQREAALESEMATIAGVYQNRLDKEMLLQADPTVIYGVDTVELGQQPIGAWPEYSFWNVPAGPMAEVALPAELAGYQTYQQAGLPPGPLATPTVAAIDAALEPDQAKGYLYFVAIPGGEGTHDFSRTYDEHLAKLKKYGYIK
jgi:UPF0755 protein